MPIKRPRKEVAVRYAGPAKRHQDRSKYIPHQGKRELARRAVKANGAN